MDAIVYNRIGLYGSDDDAVSCCLNDILGIDGQVTFEKLVPMPDALRGTAARFFRDGSQASSPMMHVSDDHAFGQLREPTAKELAAIADTGYVDWREWRIAAWGTPQDATETLVASS